MFSISDFKYNFVEYKLRLSIDLINFSLLQACIIYTA